MPLGSILAPDRLPVGDGEAAEPDPRRLLLVFRMVPGDDGPHRRDSLDRIRKRLSTVGLRLIGDAAPRIVTATTGNAAHATAAHAVNHSERYLWVEDAQAEPLDERRLQAILKTFGKALDTVAPVFRSADGVAAAVLPHVLLVEERSGAPPGALAEVLRASGAVEDPVRSQYLGGLRYLVLAHSRGRFEARELKERLTGQHAALVRRVLFEQLPLLSPLAFLPNDELYDHQWNLERVQAPNAWDVTRGAGVIVAVFDTGCQLDHPDLAFVSAGLNVDDMTSDGSPVRTAAGTRSNHGTHVAGIIGARTDNTIGIAGIAGEALLLPIATAGFSDASVAIGIRYAVEQRARALNMSFATAYLSFWSGPIPGAIEDAETAGCLQCASAGNGDARGLVVPALHPRVMAVGASDRTDERWSVPTSSGRRGSNYGDSLVNGEWTGVAVVAPGDMLPTTGLTGPDATHPPGSPFHGYFLNFFQTSASAPHVAAAAALMFSRYPALSPADARRAIEQSAAKVGSMPYAYADGFTSGTRNEWMGHGRLDLFGALRYADTYIRDWPGDRGEEPTSPPRGDFFSRSDIVIRPSDDDVFAPTAPEASEIVAGQENFVYVRVTSRGPSIAHLVAVDVRLSPFVGLEFHFPADWRLEDALHIRPEPITGPLTVAAGTSELARFRISAADADRLAGWDVARWHPCILAVVTALADHAFEPDSIDARNVITRFNNLAQRNLSVIRTASESIEYLPFALGHPANDDTEAELVVDADPRLHGRMRLWLYGAPVRLPEAAAPAESNGAAARDEVCRDGSVEFLDRTRLLTTFGGCRGVLTVEPGSRFDCTPPAQPLRALCAIGGSIRTDGSRHWIDLTSTSARLRMARTPQRRQWLVLETRMPDGMPAAALDVQLRQVSSGRIVGGAVARYVL